VVNLLRELAAGLEDEQSGGEDEQTGEDDEDSSQLDPAVGGAAGVQWRQAYLGSTQPPLTLGPICVKQSAGARSGGGRGQFCSSTMWRLCCVQVLLCYPFFSPFLFVLTVWRLCWTQGVALFTPVLLLFYSAYSVEVVLDTGSLLLCSPLSCCSSILLTVWRLCWTQGVALFTPVLLLFYSAYSVEVVLDTGCCSCLH
jgi:hypothetical protein